MSVQDLLKPRYKVVADYPDSIIPIGNIIEEFDDNDFIGFMENNQKVWFNKQSTYFEKYPHLFKKLEWWEERKESDMPEYVKHNNGKLFRVEKWAYSDFYKVFYDEDKKALWSNACMPATVEEYLLNQFKQWKRFLQLYW